MAVETNYDGTEWQELIVGVLKVRYAAGDFVEIPDQVQGDCGLEGFSRDGRCFQCYAPEEPLTAPRRTEKLKAKITADMQKLQKNAAKLAPLLGPTKLSRWILVTPEWNDKSILEHAEAKAALIRAAGLSFIADDFTPSIETLENFAVEHGALLRRGAASIRVEGSKATQDECADWATNNDSLVAVLDRKVRVIHPTDNSKVQALRDEFIRHYLTGQNALERMRLQQPELYESALQVKSDREEFLRTESLISDGRPTATLKDVIKNFNAKLAGELPGLADLTIDQLTYEAVADWLLRCPLDFEAA